MAGFMELMGNFLYGFHTYTGPPFIVQVMSGLVHAAGDSLAAGFASVRGRVRGVFLFLFFAFAVACSCGESTDARGFRFVLGLPPPLCLPSHSFSSCSSFTLLLVVRGLSSTQDCRRALAFSPLIRALFSSFSFSLSFSPAPPSASFPDPALLPPTERKHRATPTQALVLETSVDHFRTSSYCPSARLLCPPRPPVPDLRTVGSVLHFGKGEGKESAYTFRYPPHWQQSRHGMEAVPEAVARIRASNTAS
ncbi:hypothetical protein B0H11DRAFT_2281182 [Mycena galericulata]|nr:hypothetical protein B0H11DRAFT_2281182 [Mycena galericulata]